MFSLFAKNYLTHTVRRFYRYLKKGLLNSLRFEDILIEICNVIIICQKSPDAYRQAFFIGIWKWDFLILLGLRIFLFDFAMFSLFAKNHLTHTVRRFLSVFKYGTFGIFGIFRSGNPEQPDNSEIYFSCSLNSICPTGPPEI